ncbi:hypothetical protein ABXS75_02180 [Roseburia hominis]
MEYKYLYAKFNTEAGEDLIHDLADNSHQENLELASELLDMLSYGKAVLNSNYHEEADALQKGDKRPIDNPFEQTMGSVQNCLGLVQELDFIGQHTEVGSAFQTSDYFDLVVCAKNIIGISQKVTKDKSSAKFCCTSPLYRNYLSACNGYRACEKTKPPMLAVGLLLSLLLLSGYWFLLNLPFVADLLTFAKMESLVLAVYIVLGILGSLAAVGMTSNFLLGIGGTVAALIAALLLQIKVLGPLLMRFPPVGKLLAEADPYVHALLIPLGLLCLAPLGLQPATREGNGPKELKQKLRASANNLLALTQEDKARLAAERRLFGLLEEVARTLLEEADNQEKKSQGSGKLYLEQLGSDYKDMGSQRVKEILALVRDWFCELGSDYDTSQRAEERAQQRFGQ